MRLEVTRSESLGTRRPEACQGRILELFDIRGAESRRPLQRIGRPFKRHGQRDFLLAHREFAKRTTYRVPRGIFIA